VQPNVDCISLVLKCQACRAEESWSVYYIVIKTIVQSAQSSRALDARCREHAAREASSIAAIIDAQSVKSADKGGAWIDDAGKKIKGKRRHVLVSQRELRPLRDAPRCR